uniref:Endoglucanase n=3 Tax=Pratylenchus vulnus TaxID=45931 RepID=A0A3S4C797_PRAVU|nr:Pv-eng-5 [Pratylenchus vulnus]
MPSSSVSAILILLSILVTFVIALTGVDPPYGQLAVSGTQLVSKSTGKPVQLHGMSLFWSIYSEGSPYWNYTAIQALKCQWNSNVVRAAMGVEDGGYLTDPSGQLAMVETVVEAAISLGIYVIVDWHVSATYQSQAVAFFTTISSKYGSYPHIIYETYNEPLAISWTDVLVPYHKAVIAAIRANDATNVIVCGTPTWSQDVDVASANPITTYSNIMYTFHFYAATHGATYRTKVQTAYDNGLPVFVTEYGTTESSGDGTVDTSATATWYTFLDGLNISYANWAVDQKSESSAALISGTPVSGVGTSSYWTTSGAYVNAHLQTQSNGVSCSNSSSATTTTTTTTAASGTTTTTTTTTASAATTTTTAAAATTTTTASSSTSGVVTVSVTTVSSWTSNNVAYAQFTLNFKNSGTKAVCGVTFKMTLASGQTITSSWNFTASSTSGQYALSSSPNIAAGGTYSDAGFIVSGGTTAPSLSVVSYTYCS